jgi:bis(5'-nucleosidyl)-tetraphosphatase
MRTVKSCGLLLIRAAPEPAFLLMKHPNRFDLPKGHIRDGESELDCAFRELEEETGISRDQIRLDPTFRSETSYQTHYKRFGGAMVEKTLVVFLGYVDSEIAVVPHEHEAYVWIPWDPPHRIQAQTIDPLLEQVATVFSV